MPSSAADDCLSAGKDILPSSGIPYQIKTLPDACSLKNNSYHYNASNDMLFHLLQNYFIWLIKKQYRFGILFNSSFYSSGAAFVDIPLQYMFYVMLFFLNKKQEKLNELLRLTVKRRK